MPALTEAVSSHQHTLTKPSPYMEPVGREHEAEPQGAVAGIAQDAADIDSLLKSTQDSPAEPPENLTEAPVLAESLPSDVGGDVKLPESSSSDPVGSSVDGNKMIVNEETVNEQLENMNEDGDEAEPAGAASAALEMPDNQDSFSLPEDVPYYALTTDWRKEAEEERQRRGSVLDLYTLLDAPPRYVLEDLVSFENVC